MVRRLRKKRRSTSCSSNIGWYFSRDSFFKILDSSSEKVKKTIRETDTTHTYFTSKHMVYIKEHNPCMMMIWVNAE